MGYPRKKNKAFKYPWNFHALKFHSPMFPDGTPYEVSIFNESSFQCQYRNTSCSSLFFCLVLWEQFPCFSRQISWMPLCNEFFSVLIFDLYYFSLLYKDNNLYIIIIVWNFIVVFYTVCFLKSFILVCVLSKLYSMLYFAFKFLYQSVCIPDCSLCVFKFISKIVC